MARRGHDAYLSCAWRKMSKGTRPGEVCDMREKQTETDNKTSPIIHAALTQTSQIHGSGAACALARISLSKLSDDGLRARNSQLEATQLQSYPAHANSYFLCVHLHSLLQVRHCVSICALCK
jgi:hypothetical protein